MLPKSFTHSGGSSPRKAAHKLSMAELLAAQKTDKSERMGIKPTRTLEDGTTEDISRLMKSCVDGVLDLSDGEGLSEDGFSSLIWGLNDATTAEGCPIKEVIFKYPNHLPADQRDRLENVMELKVRFSGEQYSWHSADPVLSDAPLNTPLNAPMTGPSVSADPGPQKSEAASYWSALVKECRQKFPADQGTQGSPEAMSKIKEAIQDAVASRCSGDGVPPTLDLSGENIDTVAIWVIEAALGHWLMPICTVCLGPLGGLDTEQRVSLLVTCLNSQALKQNSGCLDLKACSGPRVTGAPDAASGTAPWVFDEADLRAYEQVETGESQVMLELSPDAIAPGALPGLRERLSGGRPIRGLPEQQPEPEARPTPQRALPPTTAEDLFKRSPEFKILYEDVRERLSTGDGDTLGEWLNECQLSAEEWAALKALAQTVAQQAQVLAYELPAKPLEAAKKLSLSTAVFEDRLRSFRQRLGQGQYEKALALFENVELSLDQMEALETYAGRVQKASEIVSERDAAPPAKPAVLAGASAGSDTGGLPRQTGIDPYLKRSVARCVAENSPAAFRMLLAEEAPSPEQLAQLDQLATQLIALDAAEPDISNGQKVSPSEFMLIEGSFQNQIKAGNLQAAHGWLRTQNDGPYRAFTLAQWRALRDEWPQNERRDEAQWNRRVKVLAHLGEFEGSQARSLREQAVAEHMTQLRNAGRTLDMPSLVRLCQDQPQWSPQERLTLDDERRRYAGYGRFLREQLDALKKQQPSH